MLKNTEEILLRSKFCDTCYEMLYQYGISYNFPYCDKFHCNKHQLPETHECEHTLSENRFNGGVILKVYREGVLDQRCSVCGAHSLRETSDENFLECRKCGSVTRKLRV